MSGYGAIAIFLTTVTFFYFKDRLQQQWSYLATAPGQDLHGSPTIITSRRKTKQQYYVAAEKEWKTTG
jgi:hypothetical protein